MSRHIRNVAAAIFAVAALVTAATPALAFKDEGLAATERHTPVVIDALVLRPMGLMMTAGGIVIGTIPTAIVAVSPGVAPTKTPNTIPSSQGTNMPGLSSSSSKILSPSKFGAVQVSVFSFGAIRTKTMKERRSRTQLMQPPSQRKVENA